MYADSAVSTDTSLDNLFTACECGGECDDCKGASTSGGDTGGLDLDSLFAETNAAPIPDVAVDLPRTGIDVELALGADTIRGVDRFMKSFENPKISGVDHLDLSPALWKCADDLIRGFEQNLGADTPVGANEPSPYQGGPGPAVTFTGTGNGGAQAPTDWAALSAQEQRDGIMEGVRAAPGNGSGVSLNDVLNTIGGVAGNVMSNLSGNQGIHPAGPIPMTGPVFAPEPMVDSFGLAYAPVRVNGAQIDLEPNPTQWFSKHPLITMVMGALVLYVLIFVIILAKK